MHHDIFISHSSKDKLAADAACAALERNGIRCWIAPRDVVGGVDYVGSLDQSHHGSAPAMLCCFFEPRHRQPRHIKSEITLAFDQRKIILPLRIENIQPAAGMGHFLRNVHWLDAYTPPIEAHLQNMVDTLLRLVPDRRQGKAPSAILRPEDSVVSNDPSLPPGPRTAAPKLKKKEWWWAIPVVAMVAGLIFWGVRRNSLVTGPPPTPQPTPAPIKAQSPAVANPPAGQGMKVGLPGNVTLDLVWIAPGVFNIGSPDSEEGRGGDEGPLTSVTLTKGFWLAKYDVTQGQYEALMGANPSHFKSAGSDAPVEEVSWDDAMAFCQKLTKQERATGNLPAGYAYTLPTEAQWEYACRADTTGPYYAGDLNAIAWYNENTGNTTHPVGQKQPNAWGLYDMLGNVWDWCADWYGAYPGGTVTDPAGPSSGSFRVSRGGG